MAQKISNSTAAAPGQENKGLFRHVPQLQPDVMQADGCDKNRSQTAAIGTQHIGKNLVSRQRRRFGVQMVTGQCLPDALLKRFSGTGHAVETMGIAKPHHPLVPAVGYDAQEDLRLLHGREPAVHGLGGHIGGVRYNRIVKIHKQRPDTVLPQELRR